ncbi:hypothetical protein B0A52_00140 [Exophiala mesophila]|uniref:Xylose isomerase-like TIM barrel domain-containing protein n=1 Tax=Exophiala mesophila TaxID=212818 RepID=A0A438NJ72_EXOME|nr:hypothetical protein B0A52_00140 [Exophiala mesophila]
MASVRVRIAIATNALGKAVSGHTIETKLEAVKRHGFDGIELAFEDLESHTALDKYGGLSGREDRLRAAAADIKSRASALSLEIIALNPFGFYDGLIEPADIEERLQEAELWLQLCQIVEAPILQICSCIYPLEKESLTPDIHKIAANMRRLGELALRYGKIVAYEATAWGIHIDTWQQIQDIVVLVDLPNVRHCLDTFHIAAKEAGDPFNKSSPIRPGGLENLQASLDEMKKTIRPSGIGYFQLSDASVADPEQKNYPRRDLNQPSYMTQSRNCRTFPCDASRLGGSLPALDVAKTVFELGYRGALEIMETITVDVLVCGGGMSGLACAAFAAESGAKVLVVEKQANIGGSSLYSAGMFWGPRDYEALRQWVPDGDRELQRAWMDDYLPAVEWMRQMGVPTSQRFSPIMTIGVGYPIKIPHLHDLHLRRIKNSGTESEVWTRTQVIKLLQDNEIPGSRVSGAIIQRWSSKDQESQYIKVRAKRVVLATGGFQGSSDLTSKHLGPGADNIFVRSNQGSVGDGLNLASSAGAGNSRGMGTYYGHLLAAPLRREAVTPYDFLPLAQYQSRHCLLINESGRRFIDETLGDEVVNQYLAKQDNRRGFLLFDDRTRRKHCVSALFPNAGDVDRLAKARSHGCNVASAPTLEGLVKILEGWGVNGQQARHTIEQYHRAVTSNDGKISLDVPVGRAGTPPDSLLDGEADFFAMEVQPSITFSYGGIAIDRNGHAMTADKAPIPGLLVAGVDAGGFSNLGYAGGLALAFVTGFWTARTIARELGLVEPKLPSIAAEDRDLTARASL